MEERRKHQRFKLNESCIINHSEVVGTITDLSMGGLSCFCIDENCCRQGMQQEVDIYCRKDGVRAEGLAIRVVGAEVVPGKFADEFGVCRCRLQFVQLAEVQVGQLRSIILNAHLSLPSPTPG